MKALRILDEDPARPEFTWRRFRLAEWNRHLLPTPRFLLWTSRWRGRGGAPEEAV